MSKRIPRWNESHLNNLRKIYLTEPYSRFALFYSILCGSRHHYVVFLTLDFFISFIISFMILTFVHDSCYELHGIGWMRWSHSDGDPAIAYLVPQATKVQSDRLSEGFFCQVRPLSPQLSLSPSLSLVSSQLSSALPLRKLLCRGEERRWANCVFRFTLAELKQRRRRRRSEGRKRKKR